LNSKDCVFHFIEKIIRFNHADIYAIRKLLLHVVSKNNNISPRVQTSRFFTVLKILSYTNI